MPPTLPFHPGAPRKGTTNPLARSSARAAARAPELDAFDPAREGAGAHRGPDAPRRRAATWRGRSTPASTLAADHGGHVLDEEYRVSADEVVTAVRRIPAAVRAIRAVSGRPGPSRRRRAAGRGAARERHRAALHASGRGDDARARGARRGDHHAHRVGQDALLQRAGPVVDSARSVVARALPVSDQGARARPARRTPRPVRARRQRDAHRRLHLRRRHARRRAARDPDARAHRPQQPGHAALRDSAAPSALGQAIREPALRGDRRIARVSRRLRQSSRQHSAAAAPHLPALRLGSDVHLHVRDHRQSGGARRAADGTADDAGEHERRAARREVLPVRQSAGRQSAARASGDRICRKRGA